VSLLAVGAIEFGVLVLQVSTVESKQMGHKGKKQDPHPGGVSSMA
jgi:hypothetical protein